jgi:site-specific DNA-methyltransferase (adenine-specific)
MAGYLIKLDAIKTALAKASSVADCKQLRDKAQAIAVYARTQTDCKAIERSAAIIRLRAERRLGELLAKTVRKGSKSNPGQHIPAGITRMQSSRWQAIARLPEKQFEAHLRSNNPSTKALVALAVEHRRKQQRQRGPSTGFGILTGDSQQLWSRIADGSVDLFLTDPPYADINAYVQLGELAAAKLKDGGVCAVYSGQFHLPEVIAAMGSCLSYYWTIALLHAGSNSRVNARRVTNGWKPILVYVKGKPQHDWIVDCLHGGNRNKELHEWEQAQSEAEYLIEKLTLPRQLVVDPFVGSGTVLTAAKKLGRRYLGVEIDGNVARGARRRLAA